MEQNEDFTTSTIEPSQETIEQGAAFIGGVLKKAALGRHEITVSTARGVERIVFAKDSDGSVFLSDEDHRLLFGTVLVALELDKVLGVTIRSFAGAANPRAEHEVCGWVVTSFSIRALNDNEVREAYCVDSVTGEKITPDPPVEFKTAWNIKSAPSAPKK